MPHRQKTWIRRSVVAIGLLETALAAAFVGLMLSASDPLGRAIGQGMAKLIAIPYLALALPGLLLGLAGRWLNAALWLVLLAVPAAALIWLKA